MCPDSSLDHHSMSSGMDNGKSAEGNLPQLILSSHCLTLPSSDEDAQDLLRFIRSYQSICEQEENLALEKLNNTMAYLRLLRKDIEMARTKVVAADRDVGKPTSSTCTKIIQFLGGSEDKVTFNFAPKAAMWSSPTEGRQQFDKNLVAFSGLILLPPNSMQCSILPNPLPPGLAGKIFPSLILVELNRANRGSERIHLPERPFSKTVPKDSKLTTQQGCVEKQQDIPSDLNPSQWPRKVAPVGTKIYPADQSNNLQEEKGELFKMFQWYSRWRTPHGQGSSNRTKAYPISISRKRMSRSGKDRSVRRDTGKGKQGKLACQEATINNECHYPDMRLSDVAIVVLDLPALDALRHAPFEDHMGEEFGGLLDHRIWGADCEVHCASPLFPENLKVRK
ncbi:hypothetical protein K438DRAFT_2167961 [Mycena galopus ATCC 62051]|nr:hypothetical protein K438DRAFT_2167961 [Mycena galopus ATCC 62051]